MIKKLVKKLISILDRIPFVKFALVGTGGMVTNLLIFFFFVDVLGLWPIVFAVVAFLIAGTQNYILHHLWTFNKTTVGEKFSFLSWVKFNLAASVGLGISILVMELVLHSFEVPLKVIAQGCGVSAGTVANYLGSKYLIFNKKKVKNEKPDPVKTDNNPL